jgi:REP element-mobilizing transposase RayT
VRIGLPNLREQSLFLCIRRQIGAAKQRFVRIVHFSVQSNHLHLLVEASDRGRLSCGMKGLGVRVARALNGLLGTRGTIWDDRYHARALKTPREVRNALVYVLFNHRKHGRTEVIDSCSSAQFFDGWTHQPTFVGLGQARGSPDDRPVVPSEIWLMSHGWKRLGLLGRHERPA